MSPMACAPTGYKTLHNRMVGLPEWRTSTLGDIQIVCGTKVLEPGASAPTCVAYKSPQDYIARTAGPDAVFAGFAVRGDEYELVLFFCRRFG